MKISTSYIKAFLSAFLICAVAGCVSTPAELDDLDQDANKLFVRKAELPADLKATEASYKRELLQQARVKKNLPQTAQSAMPKASLSETTFNPGDTLRLSFAGMPKLDGLYQLNADGNLELPFSKALKAAGKTRQQLVSAIKQQMIQSQWFYADTAYIDISVVRLAAVNVAVLGAVFSPGRVLIDSKPANKAEDPIQNRAGAFSQGRNLVAALSASGGIRPDADLQYVFLKRNNQIHQLDIESIISGTQFTATPSLNDGDVIFVSSTGVERTQLIRPSQITPPGMRVFMSNLTAPALSNAQSAVGADATRLPYGSSLLDSAISANCVGGTQMANASRSIILVTRNHGANQQLLIKRSINELLANSSQVTINPFLMPNDGVACYDSKFTNFRDVARGITEVISPLIFGGLL